MNDPRTSDEATGLPPLENVENELAILALVWTASEGVVASPLTEEPQAVRYLHVRGIVAGDGGPDDTPVWAQAHIAVPFDVAMEMAAALAKGTTEQLEET